MEGIYQRTELLLGKDNLNKIKNSNVCIVGIGGVGSFVLEALARVGVGKITIIDKDVVDITNINRQLIATEKNIGKSKVDEAKKRINQINSEIKITAIQTFVDENNVDKYITKDYDYVIDAIDSVNSKICIIQKCKELGINIISCMGTANKVDPFSLKIADISKTEVCPLAKVIRKKLKELKISKVKVLFSTEVPKKNDSKILGSVSFVPSTAGLVIASEVVKDLIK